MVRQFLIRWAGRSRRRAERGAALPEYALAVGLIAVALVGAVNRFQSAAKDQLETRASSGAPDLAEATTTAPFDPGVTTTAAPSATTTTVAGASPPSLAATTSKNGSKWTMTVTVTLTSSSGQPLIGAKVTTSWNPGGNGTTTCTTVGPSGVCNVTQDQMRISDTPTATMTVVSVEGPSGPVPVEGASITAAAPS